MRYSIVWILLVFLSMGFVLAQDFQDPFREPDENSMLGGLGMTWIDGKSYTTITLAPEIAFGKFGAGLFVQLLMDNNNSFKLRTDEYKGVGGVLRMFRYVRYGHKYDPFYARVGTLDAYSLGNGFLMWNYNSASNYDKRKIGLALDVDMGVLGFETMTNNLARLELIGANLYFRPIRLLNPEMPVLRNLRVYGTYILDHDLPSWETPGEKKDLMAYGGGVDLRWLNLAVVYSTIYWDYGKFVDFGSGNSLGINLIFPDFIGIFGLAAKFEKRFLGEQFQPNFFGPMYDLHRELDPFEYPYDSNINLLKNAPKTEGYFGELVGHIIHKVRLVGNYQRLNGIKYSGRLHLEAKAPDLIPRIVLMGYYDKVGIETFTDFRTLDNRSIALLDVGYRINRFMVLSMVYRWYWVKNELPDGTTEYKPVERVEPRLSFSWTF